MKLRYIVHNSCTVKEYAKRAGISQKALKDIKLNGDILVNAQHVNVNYDLNIGDDIQFIFPEEINNLLLDEQPLKIIYEDEYLMVVYKDTDCPSIPTRKYPNRTLANQISYYYKEHYINAKVHLVNRLDKDTRGLVLVAKSRYIHDCMSKTPIEKIYRAHVVGKVEQGTINAPIYREGISIKRIIDDRGKPSITHYKQRKDWTYFKLETGRTHQIRVHMASIGHPLVGDVLYGNGTGEFDLESIVLAFTHPITKLGMYIEYKN